MAVLGPYASVNMNGHNNIHSQLTKSLERILEDAYLSGELKLSGRKLKEFPKPVKYDLSDTVLADLSKNRFSEVPDELTTFVFLEKLLLSQNVLRCLPDAVGGLQSLTYLDLSSNQLAELPREICMMPLQVLLVPDNALTSLPKEIGKMTSLAELDASNNRLTQVPMTLGDCAGLRDLDLSNNQLGLLPLQITYLRLEHLNVSCNCISSLPLELRNMNTLVTLNLDNNPLVSPPTTVCMRGRVHIFKYLENMANKDTLPHRRVEETRRTGKHSSFSNPTNPHQITSGNATIDCLRHKPRHVIDSGYCTDGVEKRWSNDGGEGGSGRSTPSTPSTLSPGTALSRTQSLSSESPLAPPLTPQLSGVRISPEASMSNGDDKTKLAHQQTYRQYKEALRQQRQQDVYRRPDQPSPEQDSTSHNPSPTHKPQSPINGYSNVSPSLYRSISSNNTSLNQPPSSPLLHSTPRRFQNGNTGTDNKEENKRPVQKVVPSRNVNNSNPSKVYTLNGNDYRVNGVETYTKPTSPTKSPTNTLGYKSSIPRINGDTPKLLTTSVSYVKGTAVGPTKLATKMSWNKDVAGPGADKLSFTMKREFDKQREEEDLLHQLRTIIETRLKMSLPEQLAPILSDGVVLCHLANHVRPRSVASVHVPSPAQPKLTMARCRRNVDNFLEACRKIGVEEELICSPEDVLGGARDGDSAIVPLARTVRALLAHAHASPPKDITTNHNSEAYDVICAHDYASDLISAHDYTNEINDYTSQDYNDVTSVTSDYASDTAESSMEINYQRSRYSEERYVSNFNIDYNQSYAFDESEEYQVYENNNVELEPHYSPVYVNEGLKSRGPYYQKNRVQFVTPFCKQEGVLKSTHFEIYDTDEVDCPTQDNSVRYDRARMNLNIENNLNRDLILKNEEETIQGDENRLFITCLCLGTFFVSAILLILYPL